LGFVKNITHKGCFISLSSGLDAYCLLRDISGKFIKDIKKEFPIGKLVSGVIISIDKKKKRINISLKKEKRKIHDNKLSRSFSVSQKISAIVESVREYGVLCKIINTNFIGLLHKNDIPENYHPIKKFYKKGKRIKLEISDLALNKLSFRHTQLNFALNLRENVKIDDPFKIKLKDF